VFGQVAGEHKKAKLAKGLVGKLKRHGHSNLPQRLLLNSQSKPI
jgi:hypothetical protein